MRGERTANNLICYQECFSFSIFFLPEHVQRSDGVEENSDIFPFEQTIRPELMEIYGFLWALNEFIHGSWIYSSYSHRSYKLYRSFIPQLRFLGWIWVMDYWRRNSKARGLSQWPELLLNVKERLMRGIIKFLNLFDQ